MNVGLILRLAVEIARETQGLGTNFETRRLRRRMVHDDYEECNVLMAHRRFGVIPQEPRDALKLCPSYHKYCGFVKLMLETYCVFRHYVPVLPLFVWFYNIIVSV